MVTFSFEKIGRILCLGAHPDDIEIGCGGTILKLLQMKPDLEVAWVVFSAVDPRDGEARAGAQAFLEGARNPQVLIKGFTDGYFPTQAATIKEDFERLKAQVQPDLIFTHSRLDSHQDHRTLCELTWNTFRNHLILEYEIVKYDGDFGAPTTFVPLPEALCQRKVDLLMQHFKTQVKRHWFTPEVFMSVMRLRGLECVSATRYAEAFYCKKVVLG